MASDKHRYFCFLVYPESSPENWLDLLKRSHGSYAVSPLHEPDGECNKKHYHVVYRHGAVVTLDAAKAAIPSEVPANGHIEPCTSPRNYQRYLIHLDDPEKQQFEDGAKAITCLNAFPLDLSRDYSAAELKAFRSRVFEWVRDYDVLEYADLLDQLMDSGELDLLDYASNHTILFNTYITSRRQKRYANEERQ